MSNAPLLEMRNIKKDFFGNQVLTDINLTLREGEVLGLCGENGAGKSTLMKILFGMDVIRETGGYGGDILLGGEKAEFATPFDALAAGIGMVHQEFSLIPGFTATENILLNREPEKHSVLSEVFGERLNTLNHKEMDARSAAAIEKMGVRIDADAPINTMPVGHKQFTEIARELSKEQLRLLILDEPTAVLTEKEAEALLESIRSMSGRGIAIIFITHRLHEILAVCDKVVVMRDGRVVQDGSAAETTVGEITRNRVGRSVETGGEAREARDVSGFRTILSIRRLWVDMPGEIVRNISTYSSHSQIGMFCIAALLVGGASVDKASIGNVFLGVILFHTMFIVAPRAGAAITGDSMIGEYFRVFCSYGVIINLPGYLAGLPEEAYISEFIATPTAEELQEEAPPTEGDELLMRTRSCNAQGGNRTKSRAGSAKPPSSAGQKTTSFVLSKLVVFFIHTE